jgi:hypothetical protein
MLNIKEIKERLTGGAQSAVGCFSTLPIQQVRNLAG